MSLDSPTTASPPPTTKPWPHFFNISALSFPVSLSDATARLTTNIAAFQLNYLNMALIILFLSLALRPLSFLLISAVSLAWYFLYFSRNSPLEILGFDVDDRFLVGVLSVVTVVVLFISHAWMNLVVSGVVAVVFVILHGVLRSPSFGDQDPYGGLLDAEAGAYSQI